MTRGKLYAAAMCLWLASGVAGGQPTSGPGRRDGISPSGAQQYADKMKAGWIGQMAGVAWGAPTEFS